jgi:uncharacterized protein DUF4386
MSTAVMTHAAASPKRTAHIAGVFYLLCFITGLYALQFPRSRLAFESGLVAAAFYVVVTLLFYRLFKAVNRKVSLIAATISVAGCVYGAASVVLPPVLRVDPLVFFGFYCLLIGYLILKSWFLPRWLGAGMMVAGICWLTFISAQLAKSLTPYNSIPGLVGEGALTLWLLVMGVNAQRWKQQAGGGDEQR